jgi:hypothetical protein
MQNQNSIATAIEVFAWCRLETLNKAGGRRPAMHAGASLKDRLLHRPAAARSPRSNVGLGLDLVQMAVSVSAQVSKGHVGQLRQVMGVAKRRDYGAHALVKRSRCRCRCGCRCRCRSRCSLLSAHLFLCLVQTQTKTRPIANPRDPARRDSPDTAPLYTPTESGNVSSCLVSSNIRAAAANVKDESTCMLAWLGSAWPWPGFDSSRRAAVELTSCTLRRPASSLPIAHCSL